MGFHTACSFRRLINRFKALWSFCMTLSISVLHIVTASLCVMFDSDGYATGAGDADLHFLQ